MDNCEELDSVTQSINININFVQYGTCTRARPMSEPSLPTRQLCYV